MIIDEADFENDSDISGLKQIIPSRSPSPIRNLPDQSTKATN